MDSSDKPATIMQEMASGKSGARATPTVASAMVQVPTMHQLHRQQRLAQARQEHGANDGARAHGGQQDA